MATMTRRATAALACAMALGTLAYTGSASAQAYSE